MKSKISFAFLLKMSILKFKEDTRVVRTEQISLEYATVNFFCLRRPSATSSKASPPLNVNRVSFIELKASKKTSRT